MPQITINNTQPTYSSRTVSLVLLGVASLGFFTTQSALAETIIVPVGQQAQANQQLPRPTMGMSKTMVEERFGAPEKRYAAVGNPPISRWEYADYIVVFEYNTVLHTVLKATTESTVKASE